MAKIKCGECQLRAKYDHNPKSLLGRFWKWHITFCPGWKAYVASLERPEREAIITQYKLAKRVPEK